MKTFFFLLPFESKNDFAVYIPDKVALLSTLVICKRQDVLNPSCVTPKNQMKTFFFLLPFESKNDFAVYIFV
jgi:hypothetical protein